jgi:hypothetical protein
MIIKNPALEPVAARKRGHTSSRHGNVRRLFIVQFGSSWYRASNRS